ncbi:MAG: ATP-binding protein [Clostridiales bacterium]|jgi:DNA replication protein DnaC|nr:ATP-binding protein [Clostridiales bacterium]
MSYGNVFTEVMRQYERDRNRARLESERRRDEIYRKAPQVRELEENISKVGVALMRALLVNGAHSPETDEFKAKLARSIAAKQELLDKNGFAARYEETYVCETCQDTGYVGSAQCHCLRQRLIERHYDLSNVKLAIAEENFDTFDISYYDAHVNKEEERSPRANIEIIYKNCKEFAKSLETNSGFSQSAAPADGPAGGSVPAENLFFYGETGLGKTFLCNCIAKVALDAGRTVLYVTAPQIFKKIEQYRFNREELEAPEALFNMIYDCDLLIIDDLGSEFSTVITKTELFSILNSRIIDKKSTIISTNLKLHQLQEDYSDRIVSRLFGHYKMMRFFGEDIRRKKKLRAAANLRLNTGG